MRYRITYSYERNGHERVGSKVVAFEVFLDTASLIRTVEDNLRAMLNTRHLAISDLKPLGA